jgi:hypothetical protein
MDSWPVLRGAAAVVAWATVAGGLTMAVIWVAAGGLRAVKPDDELMSEAGAPRDPADKRTSLSPAVIGVHGFFGVAVAALVTYAALLSGENRTGGYGIALVLIVVTGIPGLILYRNWKAGYRPATRADHTRAVGADARSPAAASSDRSEDRIPGVVVYLHGGAALLTLVLVAVLALVD